MKLQQLAKVVSPEALNADSNSPSNLGSDATVIGYGKTTSTSGLSNHCTKHKF
jgi:hypothetical protein